MYQWKGFIIGPEDTPYFGGYYLFEFKFPTDLEWDLKLLKTLDNLDKISKLSK
jgi:hypothetical protein